MNTRLQKIEIRNFKAFREFSLDLEGRHLLVYGPNGSGKSSLYWALYTFLQSASKSKGNVEKYFDPSNPQNLLNIHEDPSAKPGKIALTLRDLSTYEDKVYSISQANHGTQRIPIILKGDLASDFITYRFFFGFSHFRNSEKFDIWPLFEKEILPFCVSTGGQSPLELWQLIKSGDPNPRGARGSGGANAYELFRRYTEAFAAILPGIVDSISSEAQQFYDNHFSQNDQGKVTLKLGVTIPPKASGNNQNEFKFTAPVIEFGVQIDGKTIHRPQTFLNEAKLTQLALSVRFAASLVNLHDSDLKLLVLDDLLVSLDMSNRMKVVEILLSDTFDNYQKIVLTHDRGFYREFIRCIGTNHHDWHLISLVGNPKSGIKVKNEKNDLQKGEDYLQNYNLDESASCLRKAAEDIVTRFLDPKNLDNPNKIYHSLADKLREAKNKIIGDIPMNLYKKVILATPEEYRHILVATNDDDLNNNMALDPSIRGKLKTCRNRLQHLMNQESVERMRKVVLIDDIIRSTERVLNPAAHAGDPPLYEQEIEKALRLIRQLETDLS